MYGLQAYVFYQRHSFLDEIDIFLFENDLLARSLPAGLLAGLLRPTDDRTLPEGIETVDQDCAEAVAVGNQQRHGRDTPNDAEHSQGAASSVALQRDPGFVEDWE